MRDNRDWSKQFRPVTTFLALSSIAATIWWWTGGDVSMITLDFRVWREPWRLFTSVLPHVDPIHLAFNIYWLIVFGRTIEVEFGSFKTALLFLYLGIGSALAQYTLSDSGVGLSGIGYGLFGFLWVLSRYDARFVGAVSAKTIQLFVVWFFLCIALTMAGTWQVGNVAHGAGAILGGLAGWCVLTQSSPKYLISRSLVVAVCFAIIVAAAVGRPFLNRTGIVAREYSYAGYQALEAGDAVRAAEFLQQAVKLEPNAGADWYNLGIAYKRLDRMEDSKAAYKRAVELSPDDDDYKAALAGLEE